MTKQLLNKKVAIVATDGYEKSELEEPKRALEAAGARAVIISPEVKMLKSWKDGNWAEGLSADLDIAEANPDDFDCLLIPGGTINCDKLRNNPDISKFIVSFFDSGKPVAAICHGPQLLIDAEVAEGRNMTSYHAIKNDLMNAGANWEDSECVCDEGLVTSRSPKDLPAFIPKMIEEFAEGVH